MATITRAIFRPFASVRLAVVLLLALTVAILAGVLVEGAYGARTARRVVYASLWFDALLGLLGLNVLAAAVVRYPWPKRLLGFVATHAGILVLLCGSFVTRHGATEGSLTLAEGEAADVFVLDEQVRLAVTAPAGPHVSVAEEALPSRAGRGPLALAPGLAVAVEEYLPSGQILEDWVRDPSGAGRPAFRVRLKSPSVGVRDVWLRPGSPELSAVSVGPLSVVSHLLRTEASVESFRTPPPRAPNDARGAVRVSLPDGSEHVLPVAEWLGRPRDLGDGVVLEIERSLASARVVEQDGQWKVEDKPGAPPNPAVEVTIRFPGGSEEHVAFAEFPEMPSLRGHGRREGRGYRVRLETGGARGPRGVVAVALAPTGALLLRMEDRSGRASPDPRAVVPGEEVATPWMGMTVSVEEFLPAARPVRRAVPAIASGVPAVRVRLSGEGSEAAEEWVGRGERRVVSTAGGTFTLDYGRETRPLDFRLRLLDFRRLDDPGTQNPASFESDVLVEDAALANPIRATIRMNEPLRHRGWSVYQSSYAQPPGGAEISVFQVARDPGYPLVLVGCAVMVAGILWMFYVAPRLGRRPPKPAPREEGGAERTAGAARPARVLAGLLVACGACGAFAPASALADDALEPLRTLAVQDGGRVKPLSVYARETVRIVTGSARAAPGEAPLDTLARWLADPERAAGEPLLRVRHAALREALGIVGAPNERVPFRSLRENRAFWGILEGTRGKERQDLTTVERRAGELHASFARLAEVLLDGGPRLVAIAGGPGGSWLPAAAVAEAGSEVAGIARGWSALLAAVRSGDRGALRSSAEAFASACRAVGAERKPPQAALEREDGYERLDPLGWALWAYLAGAVFLLVTRSLGWGGSAASGRSRLVLAAAAAPALAGLALHAYGLVLRILISGRPPVTNMYESVLWVSFGAALLGAVLAAAHRTRLPLGAGAVAAWLALAFARLSPLDPSIGPLVPVLRSNFWLTVHVPTITLSYAAFALAMVLGHVVMFFAVFRPQAEEAVRRLSATIYRSLQAGVLLLAAGTILGGIWAYDSWGRFWGWDPKEVGALAALLAYLAALHGRYTGWWREFGTAVSAVLGFQMVLIAWYGVNVLGVGLHSYGFSEGGLWLLGAVLAAEVGLCGLAALRRRARGPAAPGTGLPGARQPEETTASVTP